MFLGSRADIRPENFPAIHVRATEDDVVVWCGGKIKHVAQTEQGKGVRAVSFSGVCISASAPAAAAVLRLRACASDKYLFDSRSERSFYFMNKTWQTAWSCLRRRRRRIDTSDGK